MRWMRTSAMIAIVTDIGPLPIDALRVRVLEAALPEPVPMSFSALTARRSVLVTLRSGELTGTGESWVNYPDWGWRERIATLEGIAPLVIGADAADPPALLRGLAASLHGVARQWGAVGPVWQALSGIDMAAWDLLGAATGRPLSALLAGATELPADVPAYGSGVGPTHVRELTERALELGLAAVKVRVGFGERTDRETLTVVREIAGDRMSVFADANQAWDPATARDMIDVLAPFGIAFYEEPLAGDALGELEALAADTGAALATGENVYGEAALAALGASPALAQLQPDPSKTSGVSLASELGARAASARLSPHCYGAAPTVAASVHLVAAAARPGWVELDLRDNPLRDAIADTPRPGSDGRLEVPGGAGLGLRYDPSALAALTIFESGG